VPDRARGERERLGGIVERRRAPAERRADHLPAPRGEHVERLAAPQRRMAAAVADPQRGVQHRRHPGRAGAQAEVHVLREQVCHGVERAELPQRGRRAREARRDRPPDGARALGAVRLQPLAQRARQQRRMRHRARERADRARQRMRRPLHAPVGVQQPRRVQGARVRAGDRRERGERAVDQLAVGVEQHGHVVPRPLDSGVARGAEPRVVAPFHDLGAPGRGTVGAAVGRARVDHDELRPLAHVRVDRAQQRRELGGGVVQHDDDREGHGAPP